MEEDFIEDVIERKDGRLELRVVSNGGIYANAPNGVNDLQDLSGTAGVILDEEQVFELVSDLMLYLVKRRKEKRG